MKRQLLDEKPRCEVSIDLLVDGELSIYETHPMHLNNPGHVDKASKSQCRKTASSQRTRHACNCCNHSWRVPGNAHARSSNNLTLRTRNVTKSYIKVV